MQGYLMIEHIQIRSVFSVLEQFIKLFFKVRAVLLNSSYSSMRMNHVFSRRFAIHLYNLLKSRNGLVIFALLFEQLTYNKSVSCFIFINLSKVFSLFEVNYCAIVLFFFIKSVG